MRIKIGAHDYDVSRVSCIDHDDSDKIGEFSFMDGTIRIDDRLESGQFAEVLTHEIVHGIDVFMNGGQTLSEETVERIGGGLAMVLRDNPALVEMFAELSGINEREAE
ncbi:hypothetical protein [Salibacterium aidingense]|uniref:hypothetical protein n=1 Tax=Salibacterium aidingense TaxID=384933 RepID=UPI003BD90264